MASDVPIIVTATQPANQPIHVIVVGAGGTGGRLIPGLLQVLRRGDTVSVVDGDHVEDRNLARQNFRTRDIGENKADVMVRRYRRESIPMRAFATMLTQDNYVEVSTIPATGQRQVFLGCVDNWAARQTMAEAASQHETLWIDGGNERRGGQVILTSHLWPFRVKGPISSEVRDHTGTYSIQGILAMPQLTQAQPWHCDRCKVNNKAGQKQCRQCQQPEASCQDRIDLQTVAVNQMSATAMLNILSCILYQVPFSSCGAFFSTLNTMEPIKLKQVDWERRTILPETTYAEKD